MKKKILGIITVVVGLSLTSCEKFLTHDHPTGVTDELWWKTEKETIVALDNIYNKALHTGTFGGPSFRGLLSVGESDEGVASYDWATVFVHGQLQATDRTASTRDWQDYWGSIRRASRFLENVDNAYYNQGELKQWHKAEARALRAYLHMLLYTAWGPIPIVDYVILPEENQLSRNTDEEVYDFIISELVDAAEALPKTRSVSDSWRISKGACYALASRLALFKHKYADAVLYAKKVIDLDIYALHPNYSELFTYDGNNDQSRERIFYHKVGAAGAWTYMAPKSLGGSIALSPTKSSVDVYETKQGKTILELGADSLEIYTINPKHNNNRDPRMTASLLFSGDIFDRQKLQPFDNDVLNPDRIGSQGSTVTGFWIKKFLDVRDRGGSRRLDYVFMRYGEVLLNYVEALIETGNWNDPDVVKYINMIRNRAEMPNINTSIYNSQTKLREFIRRERQVELAFEGQRWYDIRRWGIANDVMNGPVYGATNPETGLTQQVETRKYSPNREVRYPIPEVEITPNPNMTQNPGY